MIHCSNAYVGWKLFYRKSFTSRCIVLMKNTTIFLQFWVVFSWRFFSALSEHLYNKADSLLWLLESILPKLHPWHQNTREDGFEFWLALKNCFILGDEGIFQFIDCCFVSGSYLKIQDLSHVLIFWKRLGSASYCCGIFSAVFVLLCCENPRDLLGTVSLSVFMASAIIQTLREKSPWTISLIFS